MDISCFLKDIVELIKNECEKLSNIERLRFFNTLDWIAEAYLIQCKSNSFEKSPYYDEFLQLYLEYQNERRDEELESVLDKTESVFINQKCELYQMKIDIQRKEKYDFEQIYKQFIQIYKERQLSNSVWDMLLIDVDIVTECMRIENVVNPHSPIKFMRSAKKEILTKHLEDAERLFDIIEYEFVREEHAVRMAKGYYFAGLMEKSAEYLDIFENSGIPVTALPEWDKENYVILKTFLEKN